MRTTRAHAQAKCHVALKEAKAALAELETIPSASRPLPARLLLAKLYAQIGCAPRSVRVRAGAKLHQAAGGNRAARCEHSLRR